MIHFLQIYSYNRYPCTLFLGKELAWQFVKNNWESIKNKFKGGFLLVGLVDCVTCGFFDESKVSEIQEFFLSNPCPSVDRTLKQSCERIKLQADWLKREGGHIGTWCDARK